MQYAAWCSFDGFNILAPYALTAFDQLDIAVVHNLNVLTYKSYFKDMVSNFTLFRIGVSNENCNGNCAAQHKL